MNTLGLSALRSCGTVEWWTGSGWNHLFSLILMDSACKACFGIGMKKNERLDWQSPHQQSMADLAGAMETVPVSGICSCWVAQLNGYGDCSVPRLWWVASLHKMKKSWEYWEEKKFVYIYTYDFPLHSYKFVFIQNNSANSELSQPMAMTHHEKSAVLVEITGWHGHAWPPDCVMLSNMYVPYSGF